MSTTPHSDSNPSSPITFGWLVRYVVAARYRLLGFGLAGLAIGLAIYYFSPKYYEASFILKMPTANGVSSLGVIEKHIIKPVPPSLDAKKLLLRPEEFPLALINACGLTDRNEDRKRLVGSLIAYEVNYATAVQVAVRIPGRERVAQCAQAVLDFELAYANTQKERYIQYVLKANPGSASQLLVNEAAQLTAPIRISDGVVAPRFWHLLLGCLCAALLLCCGIDWLRYQWRSAMQRS